MVIEKGANSWGAYVPDLPGCAVVAETREGSLGLIREDMELHIESLRETSCPIPKRSQPLNMCRFEQLVAIRGTGVAKLDPKEMLQTRGW